MCSNLGHKNQAVIDAIARQAQDLSYAMPGYATTARAELSQLLLGDSSERPEQVLLHDHRAPRRMKLPSRLRACTRARRRSSRGIALIMVRLAGSIAATGDPRRWAMEPGGKGPGVIFAPEVHCYKCPIRHTYPECGIACADYIEHMIRNESRCGGGAGRADRGHEWRDRSSGGVHAEASPHLR